MKYEFIYSGPLLFKIKVKQQDVNLIKKLCFKKQDLDIRSKLVGLLDEEYKIEDIERLMNILSIYLDSFKEAYKNWYAKSYSKIELKEAWVNYMKAGECNPVHFHSGCSFSSVLYLNIPEGIKDEILNSKSNNSKPVNICFTFCAPVERYIFSHYASPQIGDFYIFPKTLLHSVNSFKSKGERVSIACNFNIYD
jgi:uncharacterized protein (TIGR02466 family)